MSRKRESWKAVVPDGSAVAHSPVDESAGKAFASTLLQVNVAAHVSEMQRLDAHEACKDAMVVVPPVHGAPAAADAYVEHELVGHKVCAVVRTVTDCPAAEMLLPTYLHEQSDELHA